MPLAETYIGLLAWFTDQVRLMNRFCTAWIVRSGLFDGQDLVLYSVVWDYEASLPW